MHAIHFQTILGQHWFYELKRCDTMILRFNKNWCVLDLIDSYQFLLVTTSHTSSNRVFIAFRASALILRHHRTDRIAVALHPK